MKNKDQVLCKMSFERLQKGNEIFVNSNCSIGDISIEKRKSMFINGQKPYAVIISCSDSRVLPESIFSAGIGELFVIRVVGNVVDTAEVKGAIYFVDTGKVEFMN